MAEAPTLADGYEELSGLKARSTRRTFLRLLAVGAGSAAAGPMLWRQPSAGAASPPAGLHVGLGTDPTRQLAVSWLTRDPVTNPFVEIAGSRIPAETRAVAGIGSRYHHVLVDRLDPGTAYQYRVGHDGATSALRTLTSAPAGPQVAPFRFTAFGDQGVDEAAAQVAARVAGLKPAFHLIAGDLSYANSSGMGRASDSINLPVWDRWFVQNQGFAAAVPTMPSFGNHDMEHGHGPNGYAGHQARFSLPRSELFGVYAFRWSNVAVVAIDANDVSTEITANKGYSKGAQVRWLDRTLGQLRADPSVDWIVAHYHHCSYCTILVHGSDGGCRMAFDELFDRHQVDLVINGHNHGYERTHPLKQGEMTSTVPSGGVVRSAKDGTVFVCAGGGGQVSYPAFGGPVASYVTDANGLRIPELAMWSAARLSGYSFISVDVVPPGSNGRTTMAMRALNSTGALIDRITFERVRTASAGPAAPAVSGSAAAAGPSGSVAEAPSLPATGDGASLTRGAAAAAVVGAAAALSRVVRHPRSDEGTTSDSRM